MSVNDLGRSGCQRAFLCACDKLSVSCPSFSIYVTEKDSRCIQSSSVSNTILLSFRTSLWVIKDLVGDVLLAMRKDHMFV